MEIHSIKNKGRLLLLVMCLAMFSIILMIGKTALKGNFYGSIKVCPDFDSVIEGKNSASAEMIYDMADALYYNGQAVPFAMADCTYYLSQEREIPYWQGQLSVGEGFEIYLLEDEMWNFKSEAIASGHTFSMLVVGGGQCQPANLVISGLPVMALTQTATMEEPELISVLHADEKKSYEGYCSFGMRGQTSASLPKYGYKLQLYNKEWNAQKTSLLGLRYDDDWILNPLYSDSSKVREKMAYQIWEEIQEKTNSVVRASNITYVELVVNHQYWGIYGLQERIDAKQTSLKDTDVMYRKTDLQIPEESDFVVADATKSIRGFEIRQPKEEEIKAEDWEPLREYVEYVYDENQVTDIDKLADVLDIDNAVDYELYIQLLGAWDNVYKNFNYIAYYRDGVYKMYQTPWDLNYVMGDGFAANDIYTEYNTEYETVELQTREYSALFRADSDLINKKMRETWQEYRESIFSEEHLKEMAQEYTNELIVSGALARDSARWPESENSSDLSDIYGFIEKRLAFLDAYYEEF